MERLKEVEKIWLNGKVVDWKNAKVHFLTHALHYGSGVFEGIRCYNTSFGPAIFRFSEHLDRFFNSAKIFGMKMPYSKEEIASATKELIKINKLKECYIRPLAFLGYGKIGLSPARCKVEVGVAVWPWETYLGENAIKNGVRAMVSSFSKSAHVFSSNHAKLCGNYVNSILAKKEALDAGYEEAILLTPEGFVSECTGENIFIVRDKELVSPLNALALEGITRKSIIELAQKEKISFKEELISRDQLYIADEVFLTGTAAEVTPIKEIDGRLIGDGKPGPVTKRLQKKFFEIVHGKNKEYFKWLDFVK